MFIALLGILPESERKSAMGDSATALPLFRKIVDEMSFFPASTLRIHGVGEPILWDMLPVNCQVCTGEKSPHLAFYLSLHPKVIVGGDLLLVTAILLRYQ